MGLVSLKPDPSIRKAIQALKERATGFTARTIAAVVGRSKKDGPLPMTMRCDDVDLLLNGHRLDQTASLDVLSSYS
jgi:hypothetical protein